MSNNSFSVAIIEHDSNGDDLCVWSYPGVSLPIQNVCVNRVGTEGLESSSFFTKVKNEWIYIVKVSTSKDIIPEVDNISICVVARIFNPEKFLAMGKLFADQYKSTGDPTKVLEAYLSIHAVGSFSNAVGAFQLSSYVDADACLDVCVLKELYSMLGVEFVVLWNAMLLKKRVLVIGETVESVLPVMRTLPQFAWHRKDFSVLRPLVRAEAEQLEDLSTSGVFAAGTTDPSLASHSDLYDVLLSLTERRVTVTSHALLEMKMCSVHRELAAQCQEVSEAADSSDLDMLKVISKKTSTVITQLKGIAGGAKLTEEAVNERVTNGAAQQWLVRLATAEGMM